MNKSLASLHEKTAQARQCHEYRKQSAILDITETLVARMGELSLSRSDLARRIETSPAYITKILRGNANFTLDSLVKLAHALECEFTVQFKALEKREITNEIDDSFNNVIDFSKEKPHAQQIPETDDHEFTPAA